MGKYLGNGVEYKKVKSEFMPNDTVEGAELALEIGPKILKEFKKENFPLLMGLLESICNNKKLNEGFFNSRYSLNFAILFSIADLLKVKT